VTEPNWLRSAPSNLIAGRGLHRLETSVDILELRHLGLGYRGHLIINDPAAALKSTFKPNLFNKALKQI
jgi:hypothetical protein